jgi:hypothetical protein
MYQEKSGNTGATAAPKKFCDIQEPILQP